jgi:hypothetical protein
MTTILEKLGLAAGRVAAPAFGALATVRRARVFHPVGELLEGAIHNVATDDLDALGAPLDGPVLARFSGAFWKSPSSPLPDVLGCALRIGDGPDGDQDLLFATIRRPWTMPFAPLTTRVDDYLANHYFAVSPFVVEGQAALLYLRLRPLRQPSAGVGVQGRRERLAHALASGPIELALDAAYKAWGPWRQVARVRLDRPSARDGAALRFDPFRTGRGIVPHGLVHALRRGAYSASQAARRAAPADRRSDRQKTRRVDTW